LVATKISDLTLDATPAGTDQVAIERGGTSNFRTSLTNLLAIGTGGFWSLAGSDILTSTGTSLTVSATLKKYYKIEIFAPMEALNGSITLTFNSDTGTNYTAGAATSGGTMTKTTGRNDMIFSGTARNGEIWGYIEGTNVATEEKLSIFHCNAQTDGDVTTFHSLDGVNKWRNTSDGITSVELTATQDMAIGAEMIISHHD